MIYSAVYDNINVIVIMIGLVIANEDLREILWKNISKRFIYFAFVGFSGD